MNRGRRARLGRCSGRYWRRREGRRRRDKTACGTGDSRSRLSGSVRERHELLGAELDGYREVHGGGLTIEERGRVFPLLDGIEGSGMKNRRSGDHMHSGDLAGGIDKSVNLNVTENVLR